MSNFSEAYYKACITRQVPTSVKVENYKKLIGKSDEEQIRMKEQFAREIEATYPYKEGREPKMDQK